jgi:hypothetical protein
MNTALNTLSALNNSMTLWQLGHVGIDLVNFYSYCQKAFNETQYYPYRRGLYLGAAITLQVAGAIKFSKILKISELCLRTILLSFDIRERITASRYHFISRYHSIIHTLSLESVVSVVRVYSEIVDEKPDRSIYVLEFIHSLAVLIMRNSGFESVQADSVRNPVISNIRSETHQEREILDNFGSTDDVFSKFICPINSSSIRFIVKDPTMIVKDPNDCTYYEEAAINKWLELKSMSPMTRQPLKVDQLVRCLNEQKLIDERLKLYKDMQIN